MHICLYLHIKTLRKILKKVAECMLGWEQEIRVDGYRGENNICLLHSFDFLKMINFFVKKITNYDKWLVLLLWKMFCICKLLFYCSDKIAWPKKEGLIWAYGFREIRVHCGGEPAGRAAGPARGELTSQPESKQPRVNWEWCLTLRSQSPLSVTSSLQQGHTSRTYPEPATGAESSNIWTYGEH